MGIKHKKATTHADGPDDGRVQPSWWNEDHDIGPFLSAIIDLAVTPNTFPYVKTDGSGSITALSEFVRGLLALADASAVLAALAGAPLSSPHFTGIPTAPTAALNTTTTQIATMQALQQMRADMIASAPATLDTFNEIATAIGNDPNFATTILTALGNRLRFDAAQTLTTGQKAQALANLALAAVAASGAYSDLTGKPTLGTAAALNVGTGPNNVVQLDGSSKLPGVDGSALLNIVAAGSLSFVSAQTLTAAQKAQALANISIPVTTQVFLSPGSGTYTPTSANVKRIRVRGVGGGGGSAGSGVNGTAGNGTSGGATTFGSSLLTANGGSAPSASGFSTGGTGGTATGPAGALVVQGGDGASALANVSGSSYPPTGSGGNSALGGGGGSGGANSGGQAGKANTGGGGGGPGANNVGATVSGAAGGAAGFFDCIIVSPAASYTYVVGAGGSAGAVGTSGNAGSAGGSGGIWIEEYYS